MHSVTTARAAPLNFQQRSAQCDEAELARIIDRFEKWQAARAVLQLASFAGTIVALASHGRVWPETSRAEDYRQSIVGAGFEAPDIEITNEQSVAGLPGATGSASIRARKPGLGAAR